MILTCPNCATRYLVDPAVLAPEGRHVRCARCQESWWQEAPAEVVPTPPPVQPPQQPDLKSLRANLPALPRRQRSLVGAGWALLALVVLVLLGGGYVARTAIVDAWPAAARLYDALGIAWQAPERFTLELHNLNSSSRTDNGVPVLVVSGEVVNVGDKPQRVPPVRIGLRDAARREIRSWTVAVDPAELAPQAKTTFTAELSSPPSEARDLEISFAPPPR